MIRRIALLWGLSSAVCWGLSLWWLSVWQGDFEAWGRYVGEITRSLVQPL